MWYLLHTQHKVEKFLSIITLKLDFLYICIQTNIFKQAEILDISQDNEELSCQ